MSDQTAKILVISPILGNTPHFYAIDQYGEGYLTSDEDNAALVTYAQYEAAVAKERATVSDWTWQGIPPSEASKKAYRMSEGIMPIIVYADTAAEAYRIFNERMALTNNAIDPA